MTTHAARQAQPRKLTRPIPRQALWIMQDKIKQLVWLGPTLKALKAMPEEVQRNIGYNLHLAQTGRKGDKAKPLKGFSSAGVLEIISNSRDKTYRAVYTVNIGAVIYVLHCFQKKAKTGIATPKHDLDIIRSRLQQAIADASAGEKNDRN